MLDAEKTLVAIYGHSDEEGASKEKKEKKKKKSKKTIEDDLADLDSIGGAAFQALVTNMAGRKVPVKASNQLTDFSSW